LSLRYDFEPGENMSDMSDTLEESLTDAGLIKPVVDISLYSKLMKIDPDAARTFINSRLNNLTAQIEPLKEEMKQLREVIAYDKDKEILNYYHKAEKRGKVGRSSATTRLVHDFFTKHIGKEIRVKFALEELMKIDPKLDKNNINSCINRLASRGILKNPYRGIYKMEES
jgi:hypothetical protein